MATIEYLEKRVAGKEKEIAKLEKKLERVLKAQASNWTVNPYYYDERDVKYTTRDLEEAKAKLADYKEALEEAQNKANSRNVEAIVEFLTMWKEESRQFYLDNVEPYLEAREQYYEEDRTYIEWWNGSWQWRMDHPEEAKAKDKEHDKKRKLFHGTWNWMERYMDRDVLDIDKLTRDLNAEADRKYDFIIERTVEKVGQIVDASGLYVGNKGDLNGYIDGQKGTVKVQTIGAGGYNIQRFHFRTLIHEA